MIIIIIIDYYCNVHDRIRLFVEQQSEIRTTCCTTLYYYYYYYYYYWSGRGSGRENIKLKNLILASFRERAQEL